MTQHCRDLNPKCAGDARIRPVLQVPGNPNLLLVVMQNLFGNTWKYTSKQSAPASRWSDIHSDDAMIYFWRNKGSSFDMACADLLFGAFQQLRSAADFSGIGVGLANVKRMVSRHEGRLWAEREPGQGATLYFVLAAASDDSDINPPVYRGLLAS